MKNMVLKSPGTEPIHVLLVGNNPIEMSSVLAKLQQVRNRKIITEIAFDIRSIGERLVNFNPNFIFIDDNLGREELMLTVNKLASLPKTKDIPITVLKNSNYRESFASNSILDYLLKQNLSAEALYNTIRSALRFKKTQHFLHKAYEKRKGLLKTLAGEKVLNFIS